MILINEMKILIIGKHGQVAKELGIQNFGDKFKLYFKSSDELDLSSKESIQNNINKICPDIIVNTGALTNLQENENNPKKSALINYDGPKMLCDIASSKNIFLIHISTDYVFDGQKTSPYKEEDIKIPINTYGINKSRAEDYISKNLLKHMIVRTSSVFSIHGNNFVKTMLSLKEKHSSISIVGDQISCPTSATSLAAFIKEICILYEEKKQIKYGIYNFCNYPESSWYDFAVKIFENDCKISNRLMPNLVKVDLNSYPSIVNRPLYSALDYRKTLSTFDIKSQLWERELQVVLRDLRNAS